MDSFIQAVGYVALLLLMVGGPLLVIGIWYLANSNPIPPIRGLRSREERSEMDVGPESLPAAVKARWPAGPSDEAGRLS